MSPQGESKSKAGGIIGSAEVVPKLNTSVEALLLTSSSDILIISSGICIIEERGLDKREKIAYKTRLCL